MHPFKHRLAKEWIYDEAAPNDVAKATWEAMDAEFKANRKIQLAEVPRSEMDNFNTPDLEQAPDSYLRPGETLEDFDVTFRRPNAQGGMQQLVQPNADGSRPGYSGKTAKKAILNLPDKGEIDLAKLAKKHNVSASLISQYRDRYKPDLTSVKKSKPIMLTKEQQKIFREYKKFPHTQSDSNIRQKIREGIINADSIEKLKKGIPLKATDKDKTALSEDTIKKIKEKIKLKPGQKWNFYNPETNPTGHTYGIKKSDDILLYDQARNIGKEGRAESKLEKAKKAYEKIKADPELLAQKKAYDRERFMSKGDEIRAQQNLKYQTDKDFRERKLEWGRLDRIENPEKYKKKMNDYFAKKGNFPPGNNYKENVWRDMFRSSQKSGQERFLLVDENGSLLTEDKFPKKDGRVRWDIDGAYKKVKFYDTVTEQFVKFNDSIAGKGINFENYLDQKSVGGNGAYAKAINGYKNKDDIKNLTFKDSKGKTIRLGTIIQEKLKDGLNFINSGVNVQHPDLNNAFWKNEVSLASSNQQLNYLERTLERELRNAGNDVTARNKAIDNFKSEINRDPIFRSGITKIVEGETFGIQPTNKSIVEGLGKEFKLKNYKGFQQILKNLEAHPGGCGKAAGGRILFSDGVEGKITACAKKGVAAFIDDLKKGNYSKATMNILRGGSNFLKSMASPKELLKLRNYIGPAALGFMAAYEGGVITDDVIRQGTPLNESLANNWLTKAFVPYTQEFAKAKNLLETGKVPSNMKKYVEDVMTFQKSLKDTEAIESKVGTRLVDIGGYGMGDGTSMYPKEQEDKDVAEVIKNMSTIKENVFLPGSAKALEMKSLQDENEATRMAKKKFNPVFGFGRLEDRNKTVESDSYISATEDAPKDFRPYTYEDVEYKDVALPQAYVAKNLEDFNLKPRDNLGDYYFKDNTNVLEQLTEDYNALQRAKQASGTLGYYGANEKFSKGGIASLNVFKK